jgi:hypothetical protein
MEETLTYFRGLTSQLNMPIRRGIHILRVPSTAIRMQSYQILPPSGKYCCGVEVNVSSKTTSGQSSRLAMRTQLELSAKVRFLDLVMEHQSRSIRTSPFLKEVPGTGAITYSLLKEIQN